MLSFRERILASFVTAVLCGLLAGFITHMSYPGGVTDVTPGSGYSLVKDAR